MHIIYTGLETIADELNPLAISHTARVSSFKINGGLKIVMTFDKGNKSNIPIKAPVNKNTAEKSPQTDINRGMSFD